LARILITTFGSYGDLYPYLAIGMELASRGHEVTIGTSAGYGPKIESEGLGFRPVRPDLDLVDPEKMDCAFDARRGSEWVLRAVSGVVRESYQDTLAAAGGVDLIVGHPITYSAPLVAEKLGIPWVSTDLAPITFFSAYDPPVFSPFPWLVHLRVFGPGFMRWLYRSARRQSLDWVRPVLELRRELGLGDGAHPVFEGAHSPLLSLALFSRCLAKPQPDWPPRTVVTGFPFYRSPREQRGLDPELERFMAEGAPPVVFTLGSSAVGVAGNFYRESLKAIERMKGRAVFLIGPFPESLPTKLPRDAIAVEYASHSEIFPRAAAIVHQGGIGTTAQGLVAGRPALIVPLAHDQFDNAARVQRLGVGEVLYRSHYNARRAAQALRRILGDQSYARQAAAVAEQIGAENGAAAAADAIERVALRDGRCG